MRQNQKDNLDNIYAIEFIDKIYKSNIPDNIYLKSADVFDDKYISTTSNRWIFDYSGSRCYIHFRKDETTNQLLKYLCFRYVSTNCPAQIHGLVHAWSQATDYCKTHSNFTFSTLKRYLETQDINPRYFYYIIWGLKIFCAEGFFGFTLEDYEEIEFILRPSLNQWGIYQEIDNILDPLDKNIIVNGLFSMATSNIDDDFYSLQEIRNAAILGLVYVTGARPVQLAKLAVRDIRIDTHDVKTGLVRYSVLLPYAKQRQIITERLFLALPPEIGSLLMHYIKRANLDPSDKLFDMGISAPDYASLAINRAILGFSPLEYQAAVARGEAALPIITPTDLRHNVGHSLAMQGVSAEEIAHILGHTSLVAAKHYILATPALALIRAKALGVNPVWQNMVAMMLTGELVSSKQWHGKRVAGVIGDKLHSEIGGCSRTDIEGKCPFSEVRCCYGCLYYRPFTDGDHHSVFNSVLKETDELIALSDSVGYAHNPLIPIHETTQLEVQSVIARCHLHQRKGEAQ